MKLHNNVCAATNSWLNVDPDTEKLKLGGNCIFSYFLGRSWVRLALKMLPKCFVDRVTSVEFLALFCLSFVISIILPLSQFI